MFPAAAAQLWEIDVLTVGPFDGWTGSMIEDEIRTEVEDGSAHDRWGALAAPLADRGDPISPEEIDELPRRIELSEALRSRLRD